MPVQNCKAANLECKYASYSSSQNSISMEGKHDSGVLLVGVRPIFWPFSRQARVLVIISFKLLEQIRFIATIVYNQTLYAQSL